MLPASSKKTSRFVPYEGEKTGSLCLGRFFWGDFHAKMVLWFTGVHSKAKLPINAEVLVGLSKLLGLGPGELMSALTPHSCCCPVLCCLHNPFLPWGCVFPRLAFFSGACIYAGLPGPIQRVGRGDGSNLSLPNLPPTCICCLVSP